jgi:hypothetical protein
MKIKTSELTGAALDWAVAIAVYGGVKHIPAGFPAYSESWAQGGPIIERGNMEITRLADDRGWKSTNYDQTIKGYGHAPLIAAMRCYVASKLGDEVEIPKEMDGFDFQVSGVLP